MKIEKTSRPSDSLIAAAFARIDYQDAYLGEIRASGQLTPEDVFKAFFTAGPRWISSLLELRNRITRRFGLKAPVRGREEILRGLRVEVGQAVGLFRIFAISEQEILAGEDDRHLDFRVSYYLQPPLTPGGSYRLTLSTAVQINQALGKAYFLVVKPFHRFVVPAMMRSMIRQLEKEVPTLGRPG